MTTALVLTGGGARGAYQAGVLTELLPWLHEQGRAPTVLCGVSVGVLNECIGDRRQRPPPRGGPGGRVAAWGQIRNDAEPTLGDVLTNVLDAPSREVPVYKVLSFLPPMDEQSVGGWHGIASGVRASVALMGSAARRWCSWMLTPTCRTPALGARRRTRLRQQPGRPRGRPGRAGLGPGRALSRTGLDEAFRRSI